MTMGLMDKAKAQAAELAKKAQQGAAQGQAKVGELQEKRSRDALLRDLGAAYYAQSRQGGDPAEVARLLGELDALAAGTPAPPTEGSGNGGSAAPPPAGRAPDTPAGGYNLDDI